MISVIIPAYNSSATLRSTLRSVLGQTHTDMEAVLVDDGSVDDTARTARSVAESDPRLRVCSIPNGGAYNARLYGVGKARGEWITFCDSDDTMPPDALANLYAETEEGCDIVVGTLNLNNREIFRHQVRGTLTPEQYISAILLGKTTIGAYAKLYRRGLFHPEELTLSRAIHQNEDLLMLLRVASHARSIKIDTETVAYNYLFRSAGMSRQHRPLEEWFALFAMLEQAIVEYPRLKADLTALKVNRVYTEGVLKLNDFRPVRAQMKALEEEAAATPLPAGERAMLRTIFSPRRRRLKGLAHVSTLRCKELVKKLIGREG